MKKLYLLTISTILCFIGITSLRAKEKLNIVYIKNESDQDIRLFLKSKSNKNIFQIKNVIKAKKTITFTYKTNPITDIFGFVSLRNSHDKFIKFQAILAHEYDPKHEDQNLWINLLTSPMKDALESGSSDKIILSVDQDNIIVAKLENIALNNDYQLNSQTLSNNQIHSSPVSNDRRLSEQDNKIFLSVDQYNALLNQKALSNDLVHSFPTSKSTGFFEPNNNPLLLTDQYNSTGRDTMQSNETELESRDLSNDFFYSYPVTKYSEQNNNITNPTHNSLLAIQ